MMAGNAETRVTAILIPARVVLLPGFMYGITMYYYVYYVYFSSIPTVLDRL
jgi:hypothetical protein